MAERVAIAHFADPTTADFAAAFLETQGFDAAFLDKGSARSAGGGVVLVPKDQARSAVALLKRVRQGEFSDGAPGGSDVDRDIAMNLTRALRGSENISSTSALHNIAIPFALIAVAFVVIFLLAPAIFTWLFS